MEQKESDSESQMLEVPGYFQKPHEIFISEQADWSSENSGREETDPLCLKEEQGTAEDDEQPKCCLPATARLDTGERPVEVAGAEVTANVGKVHSSTVDTSDSTQSTPVLESAMPNGCPGDTGPGNAQTLPICVLASPGQNAADDKGEVVERSICPSHETKRVQYSHLIAMAIMDSPDWQMLASEICGYIVRNFPWVKFRGNWWTSLRHMLSFNPLFGKSGRRNASHANYWSLAPAYVAELRRLEGRSCCRWRLVARVLSGGRQKGSSESSPSSQKDCSRSPPRSSPTRVDDSRSPLRSSTVRTDNSPTQLCSSIGSSCVGTLLRNGQREPEDQCLSVTYRKADCHPKKFLNCPPCVKLHIARAMLQSPYRYVPLSEIYAYCIIHCPIYKNKRQECYRTIELILGREPCFRKVPRGDGGANYWMFDKRYKDTLEKTLAVFCDHKVHSEQPRPDPLKTYSARRNANCVHPAGSAASSRPQGPTRSSAADTAPSGGDAGRGDIPLGFGPKQPAEIGQHLESLHSHDRLHLDHPFSDKPMEVCDKMDIKEEPFPEESIMENIYSEENRDQIENKVIIGVNSSCCAVGSESVPAVKENLRDCV